jgi:hypothetical protein
MKNILWTFGDSMTFGHGCNELCVSDTKEEYLPYKKEGDDIWPNHLGKLLNYEVKNFGRNGASNDYIFDSIIEKYDEINEGDVVIVNMTLHGRIEVPFDDNTRNVLSTYENVMKIVGDGNDSQEKEKIEAVINFQYHFSNHKFYKERHKKRFKFIGDRLNKDKKLRFFYKWSLEDDSKIYNTFTKIKDHTNRKIDDGHFSFQGHLDFAHYLYSLMDCKKLL